MKYDAREAIVRAIISGKVDELKSNLQDAKFKDFIVLVSDTAKKLEESTDVSLKVKAAADLNDVFRAIATGK